MIRSPGHVLDDPRDPVSMMQGQSLLCRTVYCRRINDERLAARMRTDRRRALFTSPETNQYIQGPHNRFSKDINLVHRRICVSSQPGSDGP